MQGRASGSPVDGGVLHHIKGFPVRQRVWGPCLDSPQPWKVCSVRSELVGAALASGPNRKMRAERRGAPGAMGWPREA